MRSVIKSISDTRPCAFVIDPVIDHAINSPMRAQTTYEGSRYFSIESSYSVDCEIYPPISPLFTLCVHFLPFFWSLDNKKVNKPPLTTNSGHLFSCHHLPRRNPSRHSSPGLRDIPTASCVAQSTAINTALPYSFSQIRAQYRPCLLPAAQLGLLR